MGSAHYFVVYHERQWKVVLDGARYGPYASQRAAFLAAVDAAQKAGALGVGANVYVQGATGGRFTKDWSYGADPFPPPG